MTSRWGIAAGAALAAGCLSVASAAEVGRMEKRAFGRTRDGRPVELHTLRAARGLEVSIASYGGIVTSLKLPDRGGRIADVVLGFDSLDGYLAGHPYFGALIGRYGNRIAKARFWLDGRPYLLAANDGENHLHGGVRGFDKAVWAAEPFRAADGPALRLRYTSPDGEEGYPGTLTASVVYTLSEGGELRVEYAASTDKPTVVNLTHHSYFNLGGQGEGDILGHQLSIDADRFTPVDASLIPTGELRSVAGTAFDFRAATAIGARIAQDDPQLVAGKGYDHNFVLNRRGPGLVAVARVVEPRSGRAMEVLTTEPGLQLYSGNFLDGTLTGKGGKVYQHRHGFCLEAQHFPDSPNHPEFPSTRLEPGRKYESTTVYRFSAR